MTEITRREALRSGVGLATGAVAIGATATAAAEHMDVPGENVSLEYDLDMLETYRPRLVMPTTSRDKLIGLYGWVAKSPDEDTDVCVFWAKYTHQSGWLGNLDSHDGDHEPIQVEVDSETGEVHRVRASIYHWLKGEVLASEELLYEGTHPHLRVIQPWHQYTAAGPADDGRFVDIRDLTGAYPDWLANGLEEDAHPGSSTNPWLMQTRASWWRDAVAGFSPTARIYRTTARLGLDQVGTLEASG